jgi:hypothetical protein
MKKYCYPVLFTLVLSLVALSSGCDVGKEGGPAATPTKATASQPPTTTTPGAITSADKLTEVTVPSGWRETARPAAVQLALENPSKDLHIYIYTAPKPKGMSFAQYSEMARDNLKNYLTSGQVAATSTTTISGSPANQYEILGTSGSYDVQYLVTVVDNPKYYYQIAAWTLRSKFEPNRNELQQVIQSFKVAG